jgi:TonB dependent receptor/CarboxypepD_reg-like domain/TonB-dependent Receptor Plug Domain
MCKLYRLFFLIISLGFFTLAAHGQKGTLNTISGDFKELSIAELVNELKEQSDYTFYYNPLSFDSVRFTFSVNRQPLAEVLDHAFKNTLFHYSIDSHNQVFLTKGVIIQTNLNDLSFDSTKIKGRVFYADTDDGKNTNSSIQNAKLENKLYQIGINSVNNGQPNALVSGYVRDGKTGESVSGASIYIDKPHIGVSTDQYGYYALSLPKGRFILNIQSIGMKDTRRLILLKGDGQLNIDLQSQVMMLKNVIISAEKMSNIRSVQMGVQKLDIKTLKQVPVVFGETDLLRVLLTLPGVKSVGEASTGLNVRGGSADQNLILFNDATIYNAAHFFGLFSAFNPDVVKSVELYKSSIPARYGGRLSSVIDIESREGNKKEFAGSAGIGLITSRLELEGPIVKDKTSFILAGRTTYANWLLNLLPAQYKLTRASFYDLNLNISHQINKNNNLYLTAYMSKDNFNLNSDTTYGYGNLNLSLKWKHSFNDKLYGIFTTGYDRYNYQISSESNIVNAYKLAFDINQSYFRAQFNYFLNSKHSIEFGLNSLYYKLNPGTYLPLNSSSFVTPDTVHREQALETAVYVSDKYTILPQLVLEAGLRYSLYNYLGPQSVNQYYAGTPKTEDDIVSVKTYSSGNFIQTYGGPEYRLSVRYEFTDNFSMKASYNTERQYIHMLSNTTAIAPTDIWKLSDPNIKPQLGSQISLGAYKNFKNNTIETSVEIYYKNIQDYLDYKSGAVLVMNHHIETDVINTKGKAYGVEFMIKKATGKLNGWISYTYSRVFLKMDDPNAGELINNGNWYPADYDQPSALTMVANYRINHRFSLSFNFTYNTGRPITLPIGAFPYDNSFRTLYSDRNAYRIPDYVRADFSMNIDGNHKVNQKFHNSWTIGVYNIFGTHNPYSVYYVSENGVINGYKLSIFGSAIPFINYNVRF